MNFKEGDVVTVRSWEDMNKEFSCTSGFSSNTRGNFQGEQYNTFVQEMSCMCGRKVTIQSKNRYSDSYSIHEFGWSWNDWMFEESYPERYKKSEKSLEKQPFISKIAKTISKTENVSPSFRCKCGKFKKENSVLCNTCFENYKKQAKS